ncbi:putative plasma membrane calcium-transporting ATPase [Glonium stellatum]|uniref:Calcium-transporting ATPase n=1 Tax=Glonium stellatum TaxID=574774 RepID=A0A8E2JUN4_9PEZI|nr:putative plasma membrane calcium-transporting ATPase [Glonium stellatum]
MFEPKSLSAFYSLGGLKGFLTGLQTDAYAGLKSSTATLYGAIELGGASTSMNPSFYGRVSSSAVGCEQSASLLSTSYRGAELHADRKRIFGSNRLPEKRVKGIVELMWIAFNDKVLILLTAAATVSLALGLYQTFRLPHKKGQPKVEWVEGVTIMVAVIIVVVAGALNDYQKEQQFAGLNRKKENRVVKVVRSGRSLEISVYDLVVGEVVHLEPGDMVPADGVFISGYNVRCDESSATGEFYQMKKTPGAKVIAQIEAGENTDKLDPFLISGTKVLEGVGTYLVTCVGAHSSYGKLMMALREDTEATPLQRKLNVVANQIAKAGVAVAVILFFVLFIKFLIQLQGSHDLPADKGQVFLQILIVSITVIVIAVPEGLPLAVTLALAIAVTRMLKDNNLVRILAACETMGNATTICCDKTGTLTLNEMTVTAMSLGTTCRYGVSKKAPPQDQISDNEASFTTDTASIGELVSLLSGEVRKLLSQSIIINSTTFENEEDGKPIFVGSKTEAALLSFAKKRMNTGPIREERAKAKMIQMIPFDSSRKCMVSVTELSREKYRMYVKGAPEVLLDNCTQVIADATKLIRAVPLTEDDRRLLTNTIDGYAVRSLRTIGIAYRDFKSWPPPGARTLENDQKEALFEDIFKDMTFVGIIGIQDPLRPGVKEAVMQCQNAGVCVRMVTGDNVGTAKAIAEACGIFTQGLVMEGPQFRKLSVTQMDQIIPQLQVLARSSPEDKKTLVKRLKELGETVAVTGDGTNDGPALRAADVGFSMGLSDTEIAKEASSIVLMDDNFSSIVKAIQWGRAVNDAIKKFLQLMGIWFQITVNITAVILIFVSAIADNKEESILTPVQLLWVNLIMDTFAALALATDPPTPTILDRKPVPKSAPLITINMWKMIIEQSLYQLTVTLVLNFAGNRILGYNTDTEKSQLETLIFNSYVWMQFFNQYNNRCLDNKLNVLEAIHRNCYFIGINLITIFGQVIIIFFGGSALSAVRLSGKQWVISLILGAISIPVGVFIRLIPDNLIRNLILSKREPGSAPQVKVSSDDGSEE